CVQCRRKIGGRILLRPYGEISAPLPWPTFAPPLSIYYASNYANDGNGGEHDREDIFGFHTAPAHAFR
ncbi:hypothetical protein, partial [Mesorhizobium sp. A556]